MNIDISGPVIYYRIPTGIPILGDILITQIWSAIIPAERGSIN